MTASSEASQTKPGALRAAPLAPLAAFVSVGVLLAVSLRLARLRR